MQSAFPWCPWIISRPGLLQSLYLTQTTRRFRSELEVVKEIVRHIGSHWRAIQNWPCSRASRDQGALSYLLAPAGATSHVTATAPISKKQISWQQPNYSRTANSSQLDVAHTKLVAEASWLHRTSRTVSDCELPKWPPQQMEAGWNFSCHLANSVPNCSTCSRSRVIPSHSS